MLDKSKIKTEVADLIISGQIILYAGVWHHNKADGYSGKSKEAIKLAGEKTPDFKKEYHIWYAKALRTIEALASDRREEFEIYYRGQKNIKKLDALTAGISHFLQGIVTTSGYETKDYFGTFTSGVQQQIHILESVKANIDDILFNLESEIQYGIFKSEIDVAKDLQRSKLLRPAGAVIGVVLESHLKAVLEKRGIASKKKTPSISDYNDELKEQKIIDVTTWRLIQRCGDIRNHCVHSKEREPTSDEIDDIVRAAEKILSEIS